jgi:AraC family of transcriptional regulator, multidrug resistance transcriptional activator
LSTHVVEKMIELIEDHLTDTPSLTEISNHVGYSPFYCSAKFHQITGITIRSYIANRKLSLAVMELKKTDCRITDISLKYGFSSQAAFTHAFVNAFGCTPLQCRRSRDSVDANCLTQEIQQKETA